MNKNIPKRNKIVKECVMCYREATIPRRHETGYLFWLCESDDRGFGDLYGKRGLSWKESSLLKIVTGLFKRTDCERQEIDWENKGVPTLNDTITNSK
jgi:hypothetical protein